MVTYYNRKDLVSFGHYLLSEERRELFRNHPEGHRMESLEERLKRVNHADIENWKAFNGKTMRMPPVGE